MATPVIDMIGLPADDRRYYPFYAKCVELGIPLSIHTSANWTSVAVNDLGHPRHLDPVARDFPELRIIMSHGGYPWVLEACLLAWKYENVYLELAAHRPKYLAEPAPAGSRCCASGRRRSRRRCSGARGRSCSSARWQSWWPSSARCRSSRR